MKQLDKMMKIETVTWIHLMNVIPDYDQKNIE